MAISASSIPAAELQKHTLEAFNRYIAVTEARLEGELKDGSAYLWIDRQPRRETLYQGLRKGEIVIERLRMKEKGKEIEIDDGLIHHWIGTVFIPKATVKQAFAILQDYNNHHVTYKPDVMKSKILSRNGDFMKVYMRFFKKKVISVVLDTEHDATYSVLDKNRAASRSHTTKIVEVENPGTKSERHKPEGNDHGFLWRLYSYWRFEERDGGLYMQCEAISLTRGIPWALAPIIRPFVTEIPKESLISTLGNTRRALVNH
jgi:hypothetical protein